MAVNLSPVGGVAAQFFDNNGVILSGGKLYTYLAGTTTPATTYTSSNGATAHTNPIILDSAGRVPSGEIWLTENTVYKFLLKTSADVLIGTYDNISGISSLTLPISSSDVTYTPAGGGAVATTVQAKLRQIVSVVDFGADPTGVVDSLAAFTAALAASDSVYVPDGTYVVSGPVVLRGNNLDANGQYIGKHLFGASTNGTIIKAASGYTGNQLVVIGNTNWTVDFKFSVNNRLENLSLDDTNMVDDLNRSALFLIGTWNNAIRNVNQAKAGTIKTRWDKTVAIATYTTSFYDCHDDNIQVTSQVIGGVTTIAFYNCSCTFLSVFGGTTINFDHLTVQGTYSGGYTKRRIQIDQCASVSIINGDLEGDGDCITVSNSTGVLISNNNIALPGTYRQGGTDQKSKFITVTNCNQILSRDNMFMNWTKAGAGVVGAPPYTGIYASGSGANTQIALYDFQGAYFTGAKYNASGAITLGGSGVDTIINFDNRIYDSPTRYLVDLQTTPPTYNAGAINVTTGANWRFTAPIAGIYSVDVSVLLGAFVDATSTAILTVCVNGTEVARSLANKNNTTSGNCNIQIQTDVQVNAADYIDARLSYTNASFSIASAPTTNAICVKYVGCI
jgi:hypothetical protein